MAFIEQGARSWVMDKKVKPPLWTPCVAGPSDGSQQTFKGDNGQQYVVTADELGPENCSAMHGTSIDSVEDMASLGDLHEGAIMYNIKQRYSKDLIYTYIGSIVAALNPYKTIPGIYDDEVILRYKGVPIGELPPHVFALANEAYESLWKKDRNQVCLISGESGAGKTESTKHILKFLSYLSNEVASKIGGENSSNFEVMIAESSPILEAFGNAKTVYNNNSSRFGKFISVQFNTSGVIEGGKTLDYLLEKNRVVRVNAQERSFHIFYNIVSGEMDPKYCLTPNPDAYHYLRMSGVSKVDTIDDAKDWEDIRRAFGIMSFSDEQQDIIIRILSAILNLGNLEFITAGGAQVGNSDVLKTVAGLLEIDAEPLGDVLTQQTRTLRGEVITTPLDVGQATDSRDSLSMGLYSRLFKWLILKINVSLKGAETFHSIGVLDIFGFENFAENFLEQFNINYANEKLQQYFNRHIFSLEQLEYEREGIPWSEIEFVDNGECLDMIERKMGVISLMDEESKMQRGTDESLLNKLHGKAVASPFYIKPRIMKGAGQFGIKHYAGDVMYEIATLVEKNRDTFREDVGEVLMASQSDFVFDLFETKAAASGRSTSRKKATLCVQFKDSLVSLMKLLSEANPYFVRCLKPNMEKVRGNFKDEIVINQLRYSGMLETVRIRRLGFPVRRLFEDFLFRYRALTPGMDKSAPETEQASAVMDKIDPTKKNWKVGHTKIFYREKVETILEKQRQLALKETISKIQAAVLAKVARARFAAIVKGTVTIQAWYKGNAERKRYVRTRRLTILAQAHYRGYKARQRYEIMLEESRLKAQREKEVARQAEEDRLAEQERAAEEARLNIKRLQEEAAAAKDAASKAAAEAAMAEAKAAEEAAAAKAKAEEEAEMTAKANAEAAEKAEMDAAVNKAKELQAGHDASEAKKAEAEEQARLAAEFEKKQAAKVAADASKSADADYDGTVGATVGEGDDEPDDDFEDDDGDFEDDDDDDDGFGEYREGFLGMYSGVMNNLRKRWCVLHEGTLMWFKGQQNFIKAGWLNKMGGGTSTLGRKNWKRRWMTLKGGELHYHPAEDDDATILGIVDIQSAQNIVDGSTEKLPSFIKKDNAFSIISPKRTFFMSAETLDDSEAWVNTLNLVKGRSDVEIREMMMNARVDPGNAVGTIETDEIVSVGKIDKSDAVGHPVFVVVMRNRVEKFIAADEDDMDDWIRALTPKTMQGQAGDNEIEPTEAGWLQKGGGDRGLTKKKRYFVLRADVLSYYKTMDTASFIGSIPLNSLCSVIPPDEVKAEKMNDWTFTVHARKKSYVLTARTQAEMGRWMNYLQDVIDNCPIIETPTEQLIDELKMASPQEVEAIYGSQKVLTYATSALRAPLLPLPYGETFTTGSRQYGTLQQEAVKISHSLLPISLTGDASKPRYGEPKTPIPLIKAICQACFDVPKLRNEVYCQVIKQTSNFTEPGSPLNMAHWHLLGALCSSFLPARKFVRFLRFHLRRTIELGDERSGEDVIAMANFCLDAIKKTKNRDFPPSTEEIKGIMSGTGLIAKVQCVGGDVLELPISSSTTCGEIITVIKTKLNLISCANGFGLFEGCGQVHKYLEEKYLVADVLSKWEKYEAHGINPDGGSWQLLFKLFSFYDPLNPKLSDVEQKFLFEQAFESVMNRKFPADPETLNKLAALRMQYVVGDYEEGAYISDVVKVHPAQQPQLLSVSSGNTIVGTLKKMGKAVGTLRGFGSRTLKRLKGGTMKKKDGEPTDEDIIVIKQEIVMCWQQLKNMSVDDARIAYMDIIHSWNGYGANLFDVEYVQQTKNGWPKELWLAISLDGVGIFPRNERECLAYYQYESVLSFGAPVANKYKIMVDNVGSMLFETNMVLEIAKLMKEYIKEIVTRNK